ncbi:SAM-dependent methyltransferase [Hylemonella gracilis ATCC 19624]|uniref:SAM-dependent methyltransferase n=1 Tax=Hylemonella gracilis ATCC 19624 TaxID=887062 RepID=F3KSD1_9BURK|nr:SAM-dependent methyltransferase [Hylemonella gracilis ATCC 19624]
MCGSSVTPFISFGKQPIANGFLKKEDFGKEYFFEMQVCHCQKCNMVQLAEQPDREQMFNENYAFFSGTSTHMARHFEQFAQTVRTRFLSEAKDPLIIEMGSNDGIMLRNFKGWGYRHVGIEPSANVAKVAQDQGVNTLVRFFDEDTTELLLKQYGQADVFYSANVMCHIPYIGQIFKGISRILKPSGVLAFEDPYLGDVIEKTSYDQVYDEHTFLFSVLSVQYLAGLHGLEIFDVEAQETHGGSMRYYIGHKGQHGITAAVENQVLKEKALGLASLATFEQFRKNCEQSRADLVKLLTDLKRQNKRVVGYAATSKSTTVLNYCGISSDLIEFISDTTPNKQGKFSPGQHIPVLAYENFKKNYPDYALLFGWNHKKEILEKEGDFMARGGKWIVFVPQVGIE